MFWSRCLESVDQVCLVSHSAVGAGVKSVTMSTSRVTKNETSPADTSSQESFPPTYFWLPVFDSSDFDGSDFDGGDFDADDFDPSELDSSSSLFSPRFPTPENMGRKEGVRRGAVVDRTSPSSSSWSR